MCPYRVYGYIIILYMVCVCTSSQYVSLSCIWLYNYIVHGVCVYILTVCVPIVCLSVHKLVVILFVLVAMIAFKPKHTIT